MAEPGAGPGAPPGAERVVLWHRRVLRAQADEPTLASLGAWARTVTGRCLAGGADIVAQISGTVVASFDAAELLDAVDIAVDLADEAEDAGIAVAVGITIGETGADPTSGPLYERAELLAFRAHAGEVALDADARTRVRGAFLFARQLAGTGVKGYVVDRAHPRRDAASDAMARLGPITVPPATAALVPLVVQALGQERQTVVLRGPPGAGAHELAARVVREAAPPARLVVVGSAPGGIVPLGSLRSALLAWPGVDLSDPVLAAVRDGALPPRDALAHAIARALAEVPVLVLLAPLSEVDAATIDALLDARERAPRAMIVARVGVDADVPAVLANAGRCIELTLPVLRMSDAREVARGMLGAATDPDVLRRLASVGGDSALGVAEAVRTLVSCGDLVLDGDAFVWRGPPRGGVRATPLDVLIAERLEMLDDDARRVLEATAVLGEGAREADVVAVAKTDGIGARAALRALGHLSGDAWLERAPDATLRFGSAYIRRFVVHALPAGRRAELHRFATAALPAGPDASLPQRVRVAWHTLEGGREVEGAVALLETAEALASAGWARSAAHVAQVARRAPLEPGALSRADALAGPLAAREESSVEVAIPAFEPDVAGAGHPTGTLPLPEPTTEEAVTDLVGEVRAAIRARDPDALDRIARRAVLEGSDMDAVARMRALADLLRGDIGAAAHGLVRARSLRHGPSNLRTLLAESMVALRAGAVPGAIRLALRALAEARRASDARGEAATLFTLAASYRALGRELDAQRLEARAQA